MSVSVCVSKQTEHCVLCTRTLMTVIDKRKGKGEKNRLKAAFLGTAATTFLSLCIWIKLFFNIHFLVRIFFVQFEILFKVSDQLFLVIGHLNTFYRIWKKKSFRLLTVFFLWKNLKILEKKLSMSMKMTRKVQILSVSPCRK